MDFPAIRSIIRFLHEHQNYRFWSFQLLGWFGYSLSVFLSITLVDNNVSWPHVGHIILTAMLGILTTWPLRPLYQRTFDLSVLLRVFVSLLAVVVLSLVWTLLRVLMFAWIVGEAAIWDEFNYWYFGSLFVFLSWTVLYYGVRYYELLTLEHQKLLEESALKREEHVWRLRAEASARDAQLQMLRYQLNPHFLFNTLNAINALVKLDENDKAGDMIQLLSDFLRHSLEQDGIEAVRLDQEISSLMLYLNIEKARFEDRLQLEFDIEPLANRALVPSLILQPIIENSMKYAIATSEEGGTVTVKARLLQHQLQLEVSDTGPGIGKMNVGEGRGVGLRNTLERLETLYEGRYSFETFDNQPSGLTIHINVPLQFATEPQSMAPELEAACQ